MPVRLVWSCATTRDLAFVADQLGHLVGGERGGGHVVGGGGGDRDVAVDAGVEGDDRDLRRPGPSSAAGSPPGCRAPRSRWPAASCASAAESMSICLSTIASVSGPSKRDLDVEVLGGLLGAGLHRLPELVLEALGDQRDVGLLRQRRPRSAEQCGTRPGRGSVCVCGDHGCLLIVVVCVNGEGRRQGSAAAAAAQDVGVDGEDDDHAGRRRSAIPARPTGCAGRWSARS